MRYLILWCVLSPAVCLWVDYRNKGDINMLLFDSLNTTPFIVPSLAIHTANPELILVLFVISS